MNESVPATQDLPPAPPTTKDRGHDPLRLAYFETLRAEILQVKSRLVWLIVIGLFGVPILTWFALTDDSVFKFPLLISPLLVLLLIVLYFSEQMSMMRAGDYIHQRVETGEDHWEHWVNAQRTNRAEPQIFGLLVVVGLAYSVLMGCFAIDNLWQLTGGEQSYFIYYVLRYAVPGIYVLSLLWVLFTMAHFWTRAFKVSSN